LTSINKHNINILLGSHH